ncbi:MAG: alanine dehydrogenase [Gammaproteobacteria bacterium]|nr:alanine dehydrogenase [Gammaproteobacteria bacterium]
MKIGIPREIKPMEGRVALTPEAVGGLVAAGHEVLVEQGAGLASGYEDADYVAQGARIEPETASVWSAKLIVKVKDPIAPEFGYLRDDMWLFSYLHLAANRPLTDALVSAKTTSVAFETVESDGKRPLLAPMSDIAGRLAVQYGANLLHRPAGGKGVLLGGLAGAERGRVVVLGTGIAGAASARLAASMGAEVTVFGIDREQLDALHHYSPNITALPSEAGLRRQAVVRADLLIGAVLIPGDRAPWLVDRAMVADMGAGSVIIDISVDQGGCIETTRPTDYTNPTYTESGVVHFGVTNMPGAVPRSASQALSAAISPYVKRLAALAKLEDDAQMRAAANTIGGQIVHPAVAHALA